MPGAAITVRVLVVLLMEMTFKTSFLGRPEPC
jgi:hypothetical protein